MKEVWKPLKGWSKHYEISSKGTVRRIDKKIVKPYKRRGYYFIFLSNRPTKPGGKKRATTQHRLLGENFIKRPPNKNVVAHKNGNGLDNRLENLYWATFQENMLDKRKHGTMPKGKKHHWYKDGKSTSRGQCTHCGKYNS